MPKEIDFHAPSFPVRQTHDNPKYLMIMLHGFGSNGQDMASLCPIFDSIFEKDGVIYLCPNAPMDLPMGGHAWFPLTDLSQRELDDGPYHAEEYLKHFIDSALAHYNIKPEDFILGGFSQGAMMSFHVGLRAANAPKAILAFSGALTSEERVKKEITCKPPVFICHGDDDQVVFSSYARRADATLKALDVPVETHIYPGYEHTIPPDGIKQVAQFMTHLMQ